MGDICDQADEQNAPILDALIRECGKPLAAGAAGVCDECGWESPRLVSGKCAPCRDVQIEWERRNGRGV